MKFKLTTSALISSLFVLSGCSGTGNIYEHAKSDVHENSVMNMATEKSKEIVGGDSVTKRKPFEVSEGSWLGGKLKLVQKHTPKILDQKVLYATSGSTLPAIAEKIYSMTGIYVSLSSDLKALSKNSTTSAAQTTSKDGTALPPSAMMALNKGNVLNYGNGVSSSSFGYGSSPESNPYEKKIRFQHNDTLKSLLELVAGRYNISWRYEDDENRIIFYRLATKNFQIRFAGYSEALVETKSSGNNALSGQNTKMEFKSGKWKDIEDSVKSLLSEYGTANIIKATGDIVVTDTPSVIKKVSEFVRDLNNSLGSQIALDVKVYSVKITDDNATGIDFDNLTKTLASAGSLRVSGSGPTSADVGQMVFSKSNGSITGDLILKALRSQGTAQQVTSSRSRGLSNNPIPVKVVEEVAFISGETKSEQTTQDTIGQTEIKTDKEEIGFSMVMLPRVYDKNSLMLQLTMELTDLVELRTYPNSLIETPIIDRRLTTQRVNMHSGETLVLTGFEQSRSSQLHKGTIDKDFWLFGGGKSETKERTVLVVLITPVITSASVR